MEGAAYRNALSWRAYQDEPWPWSSLPWILTTSMHREKFPTSRPLASWNWNTSLHPDHFSVSGLLPCTVYSELHYMRTVAIVPKHSRTSGPLPYIRITSLHPIQITSPHPDNFPASKQPVSFLIIYCTINNRFRVNYLHLTFDRGNY